LSRHESHNDGNERQYEQNVDERASDVKYAEAQDPQDEEHNGYGPQHGQLPYFAGLDAPGQKA
jgi:hypothetical protein